VTLIAASAMHLLPAEISHPQTVKLPSPYPMLSTSKTQIKLPTMQMFQTFATYPTKDGVVIHRDSDWCSNCMDQPLAECKIVVKYHLVLLLIYIIIRLIEQCRQENWLVYICSLASNPYSQLPLCLSAVFTVSERRISSSAVVGLRFGSRSLLGSGI